jgi:hypothetical protein
MSATLKSPYFVIKLIFGPIGKAFHETLYSGQQRRELRRLGDRHGKSERANGSKTRQPWAFE